VFTSVATLQNANPLKRWQTPAASQAEFRNERKAQPYHARTCATATKTARYQKPDIRNT
jgi:hypothetical protein